MSKKIEIKTSKKVVPMIYAYTTPEIKRHDGWTKIGYTEQDVDHRIWQQTHTADVVAKEEWRGKAEYDDGSGDRFRDTDFHAYLRKQGVEQEPGKDNEWFKITGPDSHEKFNVFRTTRGVLEAIVEAPYNLRAEQADAVEKTFDYYCLHKKGEYLWNAKPRFGKTLAVYDFIKAIEAKRVLIVTNRPAVANSWYDDYVRFMGASSGYTFVSDSHALKRAAYAEGVDQFFNYSLKNPKHNQNCIFFISLQDLKGTYWFGGNYKKNEKVAKETWDVLVIDEAHEAVDTKKTSKAFAHIKHNFTLHLSGTPFKALANEKFDADAIYNWTYADEQKAKRDWQGEKENPYEELPQLSLFTYKMSDIVRDEIEQGVEIDGETVEYAFDLNEFFSTNGQGKFVHNESVDRFLDALASQKKFPFSTPELREELKHTFWLLNRVDSAKALAKKLQKHPVFKDYKIEVAAGDGKLDDDATLGKAFNRVKESIVKFDKTITLSVGQLTTGVTIPEWTAVLMLSNVASPALYMQAAFRAQNPCVFKKEDGFYRKERAYVFDFDPARTLIIFEQFANDLCSDTTSGKGDAQTRKENVRELLNFFPVIGEDENGEMIELDAEKVLTIPRKIKSTEVVKHGFMSNFLFQNISVVFRAPQEVLDIIQNIEPSKDLGDLTPNTGDNLSLNDDGEIELAPELLIGTSGDLFGDKILKNTLNNLDDFIEVIEPNTPQKEVDANVQKIIDAFSKEATPVIVDTIKDKYGSDATKATEKKIEQNIAAKAEVAFESVKQDYEVEKRELERQEEEALEQVETPAEEKKIKIEFKKKREEAKEKFVENVKETAENLAQTIAVESVEIAETDKREREKRTIEDKICDHLRGFSRTIPSFIMAYGGENEITLANFDKIVPADVFLEVTSITLEQFCFLRDGGSYVNEETGKEENFKGRLFDEVVFDDSVREFMSLKRRLADYFDETQTEDIFDYIPPQKTNQIFTPKRVVKEMVDYLEIENPGCFDDDTKTFADLYMKSGMYVTEIVKRLYRSERMKELYPESRKRLEHIFAKQVFGLAPTKIIYQITLAYILGFAGDSAIEKHNIRLCDALEYAKKENAGENGALEEKLRELFGDVLA